MASKNYNITGKCAWAHNLFRLDESPFGKMWSVDVYPDEEGTKTFKESGCTLRPIRNSLFVGEVGYKFKRHPEKNGFEFGPPQVVDKDNNPWPDGVAIGNGSKVVINVTIYETRKGTGPKGHRLNGLKVLEHVPYEAPMMEVSQEQQQIKDNGSIKTRVSVTPKVPW